MEKETNKRMEALACIIADLKAENMMMTERVHQLMDDYNATTTKRNMTHTKRWQVLNRSTRTLVVGMMQAPPYDRMFEQSRRVYLAKGISPTLHTQGGGNTEIKVLVEL